MQKITSLSAKVFDRQSKEFRKIGGQAFWPRLYHPPLPGSRDQLQNQVTFTVGHLPASIYCPHQAQKSCPAWFLVLHVNILSLV